VLTERDRRVLITAFLNPATRSNHYRVLFPSIKTRNERLRLLFDHGYLDRTFPSSSSFGGAVYHIGKLGVSVAVKALANQGLELSSDEITALRQRPTLSQLEHALHVPLVYEAACLLPSASQKLEVESFLPEPLVRFDYEIRSRDDRGWKRQCFAPDGALVIGSRHTANRIVLFLEIDMGSVPLTRIDRKIRSFVQAVDTGLVGGRFADMLPVLALITVSEARLRGLSRTIRTQGCHSVLATTFDTIDCVGFFSSWLHPSRNATVALAEIVERGRCLCSA